MTGVALLSRVLGGAKTTCSVALAFAVEGDVGDLLVLAVDLVGVVVDDVDFDRLAEGVVVAGLGELGFAGAELGDDLVGGDVARRRGVKRAEAGLGQRGSCAQRKRQGRREGHGQAGYVLSYGA